MIDIMNKYLQALIFHIASQSGMLKQMITWKCEDSMKSSPVPQRLAPRSCTYLAVAMSEWCFVSQKEQLQMTLR